ncbi:MAG TPA: hypothetical protein DDW98_08980 [Gammaproteobacteria bacterium]|nr:hypothetical protein [Gammaproteobacteria bacterium]
MSARDLIDGLTVPELRDALSAFVSAVDRFDLLGDVKRLHADLLAASKLTERLAWGECQAQMSIPQTETRTVRHVHIVRALTDEQREAIRREYIPRSRGGRNHGPGPSIKELANRYGVSYTAARNAVREAA